jgi:integrase
MTTYPSHVRVSGPLALFVTDFADRLAQQGYAHGSICHQLGLLAHLSRWLSEQGLSAADLHAGRLHDFRHAFAVNTILDGYLEDGDPGARLALLSTYLGHVNPTMTYWYLSAAPELMGLAGDRLERHLRGDA